jgi:NADH:ubiquinone oxidoreductase subunit 4 (subunit M)
MELDINESRWKTLYRIGAVCIFIAVLVMVTEIFLTALPDGARTILTITAWFDLFNRNWFMGMRNLGLINVIATTLMIPVFFSIFGLHRKENSAFAGLSLIIFIASYAIFMADNTSFPMLELSRKYVLADLEGKKYCLQREKHSL